MYKHLLEKHPFMGPLLEASEFRFYDILNVYLYGSRVYGTSREDSDYDYIVVTENSPPDGEQQFFRNNVNVTIYGKHMFKSLIEEHEISVLECLFLPGGMKYESREFKFELNLSTLRKAISSKSSNSYVKAKKKMTVEKDLDIYVGQKSLFHSLRILKFGIQLATIGKIEKYDEANWIWTAISTNHSHPLTNQSLMETWADYETVWHRVYNQLKTEFKKVAPL